MLLDLWLTANGFDKGFEINVKTNTIFLKWTKFVNIANEEEE